MISFALVYRFGVACTYYGISFNVDGFGVNIYLTQFIYGISEVPAKAFVIFFLDKIGRRLTQAGTLSLTGLCIFCSMLIPRGKNLQFIFVLLSTKRLKVTLKR